MALYNVCFSYNLFLSIYKRVNNYCKTFKHPSRLGVSEVLLRISELEQPKFPSIGYKQSRQIFSGAEESELF